MFPPEIIDHVLSFLQRDQATLKVCARAHPSLSKLVERHFYRHLTVQNFDPCPPGTYHPSDLLKLFVDEPNIANHVRSLRIYLHIRLQHKTKPLESILSAVTRLQAITLSCTTGTDWDDLCESFRTAFTDCLRLPTLTDVKLSNIDLFPLSALDHSRSIERLSLRGYFYYHSPSSPFVYPPLDFLDLRSCGPISMANIGSWVESRSFAVRSLKLSRGLEQPYGLLGVCANTLTTLHIDLRLYYDTMPLSLSHLPHLAQLTVQTPICFDRSTKSCLPATMRCLDTLPSPPINLVHLIIEIVISIDNDFNSISDMDWSSLTSFPYFDIISRVELRVRARKVGIQIPSDELLGELKQDPHLMQLEMHHSLLINAVEESVVSWFDFGSD